MGGETDLAVLGAGPGGYAAAFHAADLGLRVTLIDEEPRPGGVCLARGCIPSKALLHAARLIHEAREAEAWGIRFGEPRIELPALRSWKDGIIDRLSRGIRELAGRRGVEIARGRGRFLDPETLEIAGEGGARRLRFGRAVIATGSEPVLPAPFAIGDPRVIDSTGALALEDVPERLLVVGGGYIGLEMGTVYAALGSRVTVVEILDGLLPGVDRDLVKPLERRLQASFEAIHLETRVEALRSRDGGLEATLAGKAGGTALFDRVLVSVGRRPRSRDLGLENTAVELDGRGFIRVDASRRTADPRILAIGDVAGEPMLAHKAAREGKVAAEEAAGRPAAFDNVAIPAVVFTDPEIAWCGLTETQAKAEGRPVAVSRFPWVASGRALTLGRPEGLTKLLLDPATERVLGMGIAGAGAGELIGEGTLAVEMGALARDLAGTIHAHPTLSETIPESAEAFLGQATHLYTARRPR